MKQKSADELISIKGHFFDFIVFLTIPVGKSDAAVINGDDPIVRLKFLGQLNPNSVLTH